MKYCDGFVAATIVYGVCRTDIGRAVDLDGDFARIVICRAALLGWSTARQVTAMSATGNVRRCW